jgi:hypothetical protein
MLKTSAFGLATVAGLAAANPGLQMLEDGSFVEPAHMMVPEEEVGYIYVNMATGEKIATAINDVTRPRGGGVAPEVWIADNRLPCAAYGQTGGTSGLIDDIDGTNVDWQTGSVVLHWGDIPADTVVDSVQVRYSTRHVDVDADGDGFADGVEGFGCEWSWYDGDDGFNSCTTRTPLVALTLANLPGRTTGGTALSVYIFTVDLGAENLSFEIGDSDGDNQGADVHNAFAFPDSDLDVDGLADFSYAQRFIQPGTFDFDGDGVLDGDIAAAADCGNSLVAPRGPAIVDPNAATIDFYIISPVDPLPAGQGITDRFDRYIIQDGFWLSVGTFSYGRFSCDSNADGVGGPYRSFAQFWHIMFGPAVTPPCRVDLFPAGAPDGQLNFFDLSTFINLFNNQDPAADFFPVAGGDGVFNFFDLSTFIGEFNAGCP